MTIEDASETEQLKEDGEATQEESDEPREDAESAALKARLRYFIAERRLALERSVGEAKRLSEDIRDLERTLELINERKPGTSDDARRPSPRP